MSHCGVCGSSKNGYQLFREGSSFDHPSLYRVLKLSFPMNFGEIVNDGRITSDLGTGSLGQAVGVLTSVDFRLVYI